MYYLIWPSQHPSKMDDIIPHFVDNETKAYRKWIRGTSISPIKIQILKLLVTSVCQTQRGSSVHFCEVFFKAVTLV